MTTKKRLGRGLDALLGAPNTNATLDYKQETGDSLKKIPIDQLQRGQYQLNKISRYCAAHYYSSIA
jgi:hypothetical protein